MCSFVSCSLLLTLLVLWSGTLSSAFMQNNCHTVMTSVRYSIDDFDYFGRLKRTCNDDIVVNKCEGKCMSETRPSIHSTRGFHDLCLCCTETELQERSLVLGRCFDKSGKRITTEPANRMTVTIKEPVGCNCFKCND